MPDLEHSLLEQRVLRLERENRALRLVGVMAFGVVGSVAVLGATGAPPTTIEAQEFVLKDSGGNVRARLGLSSELQAPLVPPSPSPASALDPLPLLDRERGPAPAAPREVSTACLTFLSPRGVASARQCSSWEDEASNSLAFRSGNHPQVSLSADATISTLRLGEAKSRSNPHGRGVLVTLGAFADRAGILVQGKSKERASLNADSLEIADGEGKIVLVLPKDAASRRE
jgi:hypothetical protein